MGARRLPLLAAAIVLAAGFIAIPSARALTLVPPSLEYGVDPGQNVTGKIKLYNEGTSPVTVFASASNFTAKDEKGTPNFDFATTPTDLASWVSLPEGSLTLNSGDRLEIPITIKIPSNADPGGHYAGVFFGTDPSLQPKEGGQVNIRSLIGTLLIVRVSGDVKEAAALEQFGMDGGKSTLSRLPATLFVRIKNEGNVHVRPEGTIVITNLFGKKSASLTLNDVNGAVLPKSVRRFDATWARTQDPAKVGNFFSEIGAEWRNFGLGTYTATATVTYGQGHQTLTRTLKFTVIPWRLLLVEVLGIALIIFLLFFGIRQYNAAIIRKARDPKTLPGPK